MENALLVGLSRQMALSHELDIVANNIANIDTTGYKADNAAFGQFLMPNASDDQFIVQRPACPASSRIARAGSISAPGAVQHTGNPLDVAINGNAFLVVQTPRGQRYTRNGALTTNGTGQIVTGEGYQVLGDGGPITLQSSDHDVTISPSGIVTVREGQSTQGRPARQAAARQLRSPASPAKRRRQHVHGTERRHADAGARRHPRGAGRDRKIQRQRRRRDGARPVQITRSYTDIANILQQQSDQRRTALSQLSQTPNSSQ